MTRRAHTRRLLSYVTPNNVGKVLHHDRYWSVPFLELFFERCDGLRLTNPVDAHRLAAVLPDLIQRIPWERLEDGAKKEPEWRVRCYGLVGELKNLQGEPADPAIAHASRVAERTRLPLSVVAELYRRRGVVELRRGRVGQARHELGSALEIYRCLDPEPGLAETLLLDVMSGGSVVGLAELAAHSPSGRDAAPVLDAALWSLIHRPKPSLPELEALLGWLWQGRRGIQRISTLAAKFRRALILWAEGMAQTRLGLDRLAQRRFCAAWKVFDLQGHPAAQTICALDRVAVHRGQDEQETAESIVAVTRKRVSDPDLWACLDPALTMDLFELDVHRSWCAAELLPDLGDFYVLNLRSKPQTRSRDPKAPILE